MKGWSESDIKRLLKKGTVKSVEGMQGYEAPKPAGYTHIMTTIEGYGLEYETEKKFLKTRRFKFDFFIPELNLAIEYEGLGRGTDPESKKQLGGHQTLKGFTSNCEKYNLACLKGHRLLRYTALNFVEFENDLLEIMSQVN